VPQAALGTSALCAKALIMNIKPTYEAVDATIDRLDRTLDLLSDFITLSLNQIPLRKPLVRIFY
jgi:hypothetical protein